MSMNLEHEEMQPTEAGMKEDEKSLPQEPPYIQLTTKMAWAVCRDITPLQQKIFFNLIEVREDDSWQCELFINKYTTREVVSALDISESTFFNALQAFVSAKVLIKRSRGSYTINPVYFGRGAWEDIRKVRHRIYPELLLPMEQEPFVKLYLDDVSYLDLLNKKEFQVLFRLFPHYRWKCQTQYIPITKDAREKIAKKIHSNERYVAEIIRNLVKQGLLRKLDASVTYTMNYQLNPMWFGFGRWPQVRKMREKFDSAVSTEPTKIKKEGNEK